MDIFVLKRFSDLIDTLKSEKESSHNLKFNFIERNDLAVLQKMVERIDIL